MEDYSFSSRLFFLEAFLRHVNATTTIRDWILLVCFSWRYEATEGQRVNFVICQALFEIYTLILCRFYLHEKQTSRIQSLYLYFIKIVPFWLRNIRGFFSYKTPGHYSTGVIIRRYTVLCRFMEN